MMDQKLYQDTFSRLRPSEDKVQEVKKMAGEKKSRRLGRAVLTVAAACVALCVSAGAADAATDGALREWVEMTIVSTLKINDYKSVDTMDDGSTMTVIDMTADVEERDGRTILIVPGEEVDITDDLARDGVYRYERTDGETTFRAEVIGTPKDWTLTVSVNDGGTEAPVEMITTSSGLNWAAPQLSEDTEELGGQAYMTENAGQ